MLRKDYVDPSTLHFNEVNDLIISLSKILMSDPKVDMIIRANMEAPDIFIMDGELGESFIKELHHEVSNSCSVHYIKSEYLQLR